MSDTIGKRIFSSQVIYWQLYRSFTVVSRLPGFYGPIDACANNGYQALLRVPGDEVIIIIIYDRNVWVNKFCRMKVNKNPELK